jgi:hypothetical protein
VEFWSKLTFEEEAGEDCYHMNATALLSVLKRSHGKAHTIQLARYVSYMLTHVFLSFSSGWVMTSQSMM